MKKIKKKYIGGIVKIRSDLSVKDFRNALNQHLEGLRKRMIKRHLEMKKE